MIKFWSVLLTYLHFQCSSTRPLDQNEVAVPVSNTFFLQVPESNQASGLKRFYWPSDGGLVAANQNMYHIIVCWETPGFDDDKALVRRAIGESWENHSNLRFTNWTDCAGNEADIRIEIGEFTPHTQGLGTQLRQMPGGVKLNFRFQAAEFQGDDYRSCRRNLKRCIRFVAVHEFGHVIGFTHEQNRHDAPSECKKMQNGTEPDDLITEYDPDSVMNYCGRKTRLSAGDIRAVGRIYGDIRQSSEEEETSVIV